MKNILQAEKKSKCNDTTHHNINYLYSPLVCYPKVFDIESTNNYLVPHFYSLRFQKFLTSVHPVWLSFDPSTGLELLSTVLAFPS